MGRCMLVLTCSMTSKKSCMLQTPCTCGTEVQRIQRLANEGSGRQPTFAFTKDITCDKETHPQYRTNHLLWFFWCVTALVLLTLRATELPYKGCPILIGRKLMPPLRRAKLYVSYLCSVWHNLLNHRTGVNTNLKRCHDVWLPSARLVTVVKVSRVRLKPFPATSSRPGETQWKQNEWAIKFLPSAFRLVLFSHSHF